MVVLMSGQDLAGGRFQLQLVVLFPFRVIAKDAKAVLRSGTSNVCRTARGRGSAVAGTGPGGSKRLASYDQQTH